MFRWQRLAVGNEQPASAHWSSFRQSGFDRGRVAETGDAVGGATFFLSAIIMIVAAAFLYATWRGSSPGAVPDRSAFRASVAVLPFETSGETPDQSIFARGLSETILQQLSEVPTLKVAGRHSTFAVADLPPVEIGSELGVDHLLHGSVQRSGERLRVFAELVRVDDSTQLWSATFDRAVADVFSIQDAIAGEVVGELRDDGVWPAQIGGTRRTDVDTYEIYLRGRAIFNQRGAEEVQRSIEYFRDVIDRDPEFAPAWSGLAAAYHVLPSYIDAPPETDRLALEAARRAVELDPDNGLALGVLAGDHLINFRWLQAERTYQRALKAEPSNANLRLWYAEMLHEAGRWQDALPEMELAVELDPLAPAVRANFGWNLMMVGRGEQAERQCRNTWDMGLRAMFVWLCVAHKHLLHGEHDEFERWLERIPVPAEALNRAFLESLRAPGNASLRRKAVQQVHAARHTGLPPNSAVMMLSMLGEVDQAYLVAFEAIEQGRYTLVRSLHSRQFAELQRDPRYPELLRKLGLFEYWRASEWGDVCRPGNGGFECRPLEERLAESH